MKVRYVPHKPSKIEIRPEVTLAGLFGFKFVEGTHVRLQGQRFVFNQTAFQSNPEEAARVARSQLRPDEIEREVDAINALVAQKWRQVGFTVEYMFKEVKAD